MLDLELLSRKIRRLEEDISHLRRSSNYSLTEFLVDAERYGSAERFLQTAIEATIDAGTHIISKNRLGKVEVYRDVPEIFLRSGRIDSDLAGRWIVMIGFRNILVHEYGVIDRQRVHEFLQAGLQDLQDLRDMFAAYL